MSAGGPDTPVFDFCSEDYTSLLADLKAYAKRTTYVDEQWTDFNPTNPGTRLLELMSIAGEMVFYAQNARLLETIPIHARRKKNFLNLAKSFTFRLKSATQGTTTLRLYDLPDPADGAYSFTVSKHQQFLTQSDTPVVFQPVTDTTVTSAAVLGPDPSYGYYYFDIDIVSGAEVFQERLGTTTGAMGEAFRLSQKPVLDGTISVVIAAELYTEVLNLLPYGPSDAVYTRSVEEDGTVTFKFGDGVFGKLLPANRDVYCTYKTGTGSDADLVANTITQLGATTDGSKVPAALLGASCTNIAETTGAGPEQDLSSAKQSLPLVLKANDRGVTYEDYGALVVKNVAAVYRAQAVPGRSSSGTVPVYVVTVPQGGGPMTAPLYNAIIIAMRGKKSAGKRVIPVVANYVTLKVVIDAFILDNYVAALVAEVMSNTVLGKYGFEVMDFAEQADLQDLYKALGPDRIEGLKRAFVKTFTIEPHHARYLATSTTGDGTTLGLKVNPNTVQRHEWNVRVVASKNPVQCRRFEVRKRHIGTVSYLADTTLVDERANFSTTQFSSGDWVLRVRPMDLADSFPVVAWSQQQVTTDKHGLLIVGAPDDPYVIERLEKIVGKVLVSNVSQAVTSSATIPVSSTVSWQAGDPVLVMQGDVEVARRVVKQVGVGTLILDDAVTLSAGAKLHYLWRSEDGSVEFALPNGDTPWAISDESYVDTYPQAGDLLLRKEDFMLLTKDDITVNAVGGVK